MLSERTLNYLHYTRLNETENQRGSMHARWVDGCQKARTGSQTNVKASLKIAQLLKNKQQDAVVSGMCVCVGEREGERDQYVVYNSRYCHQLVSENLTQEYYAVII